MGRGVEGVGLRANALSSSLSLSPSPFYKKKKVASLSFKQKKLASLSLTKCDICGAPQQKPRRPVGWRVCEDEYGGASEPWLLRKDRVRLRQQQAAWLWHGELMHPPPASPPRPLHPPRPRVGSRLLGLRLLWLVGREGRALITLHQPCAERAPVPQVRSARELVARRRRRRRRRCG